MNVKLALNENLYYGSGNSNNATYTYTYNQWGNLTQRRKHTYTAPENQATMGTIYGAYGYANSAWGDQLTSYNMQTISYDSMGNPISYLGATLSWNGKQLTSYSKGGTNVTYAYNEDGLRTQKTHNSTTTNYYYNGSVLIGMQSDNTVQRFSYDAQGKVVSVNYNGTEYYYLRNAQGDIVKLIDGNRNTVVEYTYDSWGKLLATTGSLATSLGANQPFRYRGYVYIPKPSGTICSQGTEKVRSIRLTHTYGAANQLIRENLYYGSGNSGNKTVTYEYDEWGNILRKLEHAYTTAAELAESIANVVLSFNGNSPISGGTVPNLPSNISAAPGTMVIVPFRGELIKGEEGCLLIDRAVNRFQIGNERLDILVRNIFCAVPYLVNDALLDLCFRVNGLYCFGESRKTVNAG